MWPFRYDIVAFLAGSVSALPHVGVLVHTNTQGVRPGAGLLNIKTTR